MIATSRLARAKTIGLTHVARLRISYEQPLPSRITQPLAREFTLVCITKSDDYENLRSQYELPALSADIDLDQGLLVGILADVGEAADHSWPIHFKAARAVEGVGWLEISFTPGLYYPLKTAGYLELVYIPTMHSVQIIHINRRTFIIRSSKNRQPPESLPHTPTQG